VTSAVADDFAARMLSVINSGMLSLMLSVGHRTGLFDVMASLPPSTSSEVAMAAGLDERYVREWLGAMTIGRVVEHDPVAMTFSLPAEHATSLTSANSAANLACMAQCVGTAAQMEDRVVDCFRTGGGVPRADFPDRMAAVAAENKARAGGAVVHVTLPAVPGMVGRLKEGIDVLDVGCGRGQDVNQMARAFPASRFVGLDFSERDLVVAREQARHLGLNNVTFVERDAAGLDGSEQFDFITTFDAVHDQARPDVVLSGIARSLRPGGTYLCVDLALSSTLADNLDHPAALFISTVSTMSCIPVSLADGGMGLGAMWGEQAALRMLADAGFSVEVVRLEGDWNNLYIATRV
jgi:2-polyprenyl-3-methyl-5-hydroxy-6-metoxy-1,4-benzoquinol methylase